MQYTLSYALNLYRASKEAKRVDDKFEKYLSLALRLYVFPVLEPKSKSLLASEFSTYCDAFLVEKLKGSLNVFEHQFSLAVENGLTSRSTGRNYRSALKQFMQWLEKQAWWDCLFPDPIVKVAPSRIKVAPKVGTGSGEASFYGLAKEDLPDHLHDEFEEFRQFRLAGGRNIRRTAREHRNHREAGEARRPKIDPVKSLTARRDEERALRFLGWYVEYNLFSEEHLRLLTDVNRNLSSETYFKLLADPKQHYLFKIYLSILKEARNKLLAELHLGLLTDPDLLYDCTYWAIETRGVCHSFGVNLIKTSIAVAKWMNYDKSVRRNWSDIAVILDLKDLRNEFAEEYALEKQQLDAEKWSIKELTHEEAKKVVEYLRLLCAPKIKAYDKKTGTHKYSQKRSKSAVARMWQIYLIVKILVYCPVRQEEIRNFELGKTLFREVDEQGNPYYVAHLEEHKRSRTSKDRHYRLPAILTKDLDMWVYKWRPLVENVIKAPDNWMVFWGRRVDGVEALERSLESAKQGNLPKTVKNTRDEYIFYLENRLKGIKRRLNTWKIAKQNLESHNFLFFKFGKNGKNNTQSFGQPHDVTSIWRVVTYAIARATKALFGEERWTNPQKLRNVAEKHIRQSGKLEIADAFATFIGHSREMGDEYAEQITSEYELTEHIVDDWWHEVI
jgi:hypothetical protein